MTDQKEENKDNETNCITTLVKVRFWGNPRPHVFKLGDVQAHYQSYVVAESDRGPSLGLINSFPYQKKIDPNDYKQIIRRADEEDLSRHEASLEEAKKLKLLTRQTIEELALAMSLSHVMPVEFGKKFVVYFTAKHRIDFRELLKRIRTQNYFVELCHIDLQQSAEALGVLGSCGHMASEYLLKIKDRDRKKISVNKSFSRL